MALFFALGAALPQAAEFEVTVAAGDRDHGRAAVSFRAPDGLPERGTLRPRGGGEALPFQRVPGGELVFISPELKRGTRVTYDVAGGGGGGSGEGASATEADGKITVRVGGRTAFVYQGRETALPRPDIKPIFKRGGYIHPVLSPSGKQITDDYSPNHLHHHGIWAPWTKTVFEGRTPDFWNMGDGKGRVEFAGMGEWWSGPVQAGFTTKHRFVDLTGSEPKVALNETWQAAAWQIPNADYFLFDLVITQECATASALKLPKYHYGGLGLRGSWGWNGANNCFFLTANGETNRVKGNESAARWCHMGGLVDGSLTGIAVLCHPDNFRAPQGMRLHPSEPFFCYAPSQAGDWSIEPGRPHVARYRFVVRDGAPKQEALDGLWEDYAHPPKATARAK